MSTKHQATDESLPVWTPGLGVMGQWRMGRTLVVRLMIFQSIDVPTLRFGAERWVVREQQLLSVGWLRHLEESLLCAAEWIRMLPLGGFSSWEENC